MFTMPQGPSSLGTFLPRRQQLVEDTHKLSVCISRNSKTFNEFQSRTPCFPARFHLKMADVAAEAVSLELESPSSSSQGSPESAANGAARAASPRAQSDASGAVMKSKKGKAQVCSGAGSPLGKRREMQSEGYAGNVVGV